MTERGGEENERATPLGRGCQPLFVRFDHHHFIKLAADEYASSTRPMKLEVSDEEADEKAPSTLYIVKRLKNATLEYLNQCFAFITGASKPYIIRFYEGDQDDDIGLATEMFERSHQSREHWRTATDMARFTFTSDKKQKRSPRTGGSRTRARESTIR